jgi:hypothetical protein
MDEATRRRYLQASMLGRTILAEQDDAEQAEIARAAADVYRRYPQAAAHRQRLLESTSLGQSVLTHEKQTRL